MPAQSERLHFSERWLNAYERYRYRRHIHAFRLGLAIVFSTLLAKVFHLQHGEWIGHDRLCRPRHAAIPRRDLL